MVDFYAHRFWEDPKLEQEEVVSAGHEDMLAEMQRANAEKMAKAGPAKERLTPEQMMAKAVERARLLRERVAPPPPPKAAPPPEKAAEAPAPIPRAAPPAARPKPLGIPPAGRDDEWEDVVSERYGDD